MSASPLESVSISIPSKTFLLGEYLALTEGPALVMATSPRHQYTFKTRQRNFLEKTSEKTGEKSDGRFVEGSSQGESPFNELSPAGRLWRRHRETLMSFDLEVSSNDLVAKVESFPPPGFGGSTAEYLAVMTLLELETGKKLELPTLRAQYKADLNGTPGSAYDLVVQKQGGLLLAYGGEQRRADGSPQFEFLENWPLPDIRVSIFSTGRKLKTHEHLKEFSDLNSSARMQGESIVLWALAALKSGDSSAFIQAVSDFSDWLEIQNLVVSETRELLEILKKEKWVLAAKGCGALGADAIAIFTEASVDPRKCLREIKLVAPTQTSEMGLGVRNSDTSFGAGKYLSELQFFADQNCLSGSVEFFL